MKSAREPGTGAVPTPPSLPCPVVVSAVDCCGGGGNCLGGFLPQPARSKAAARAAIAKLLFLIVILLFSTLLTKLRKDRAPGRIGAVERGRQAPLVDPGEVDLPDARATAAALAGAEELDDPAVGRPGRRLVLPAVGEQP